MINDFPLVVRGVEHLLAPFSDRVEVCEWSAGLRGGNGVDIALFDAFAAMEVGRRIQQMVRAGVLVVVYSWTSAPAAVEQAMASGASGFVSKKMDATSLLSALEHVYAGQVVKMLSVPAVAEPDAEAESWPGQAAGLNERESEVLALLTRGLRNKEIANAMFVGPDSVKAYIRRAYRKIGVDSRTKAVLWAMDNGFVGQAPGPLGEASARRGS